MESLKSIAKMIDNSLLHPSMTDEGLKAILIYQFSGGIKSELILAFKMLEKMATLNNFPQKVARR